MLSYFFLVFSAPLRYFLLNVVFSKHYQ